MPNDFTLTVDFNARVFKISDQAKANCPRLVNVERIAREIRERVADWEVLVEIRGPGNSRDAKITAPHLTDDQLAAVLILMGGFGGVAPNYVEREPIDFKTPNGTL